MRTLMTALVVPAFLFVAGNQTAYAQPTAPQARAATQVIRDLVAGSQKQLTGVSTRRFLRSNRDCRCPSRGRHFTGR